LSIRSTEQAARANEDDQQIHRVDADGFREGGSTSAVVASTRPTTMPPAKAPNTLPKPPSATVT